MPNSTDYQPPGSAWRALGGWLEAQGVRRAGFVAFLAALLGYGGLLAYYTLANFDVMNLIRDGYIDDSFYYFEIAKNLAAGQFSTFDGGISRTNGYHPAWLLLVTPFYWVFDSETALFGIKALEIMLIAAGVVLVAVAVRVAGLPWILLFAMLPALYAQSGMLFGLEAAAGACSLGAFLLAAVLFVRDARRWRGFFAAGAFLLPWVRLEYAAIAVFATGALCLLPATGSRWQARGCFRWAKLRTDCLPLLGALAGILAYFLYNGFVFGGIVPVSGAVKIAWGESWRASVGANAQDLWLAAGGRLLDTALGDALRSLELGVYTLIVLAVAARGAWRKDHRLLLGVLLVALALGVETLAAKTQVAFLYAPELAAYNSWYYAPAYLMGGLMMPVRCFMAIFIWRLVAAGRPAGVRQAGVLAVCVAGVYAAFDRATFTEPFRSVQANRDSLRIVGLLAAARAGTVLDRMLPEDAIVGSWDAGTVGYFAERPVVNLDGLVNSYAYLRGPLAAGYGVTHFANFVRHGLRPHHVQAEYVDTWVASEGRDRLEIWPEDAATDGAQPSARGGPSTSNWLAMTSPSRRADGPSNGYRVLRFGRLVQVFIPNCRSEETADASGERDVPEALRLSWREGSRQRAETRLWPQPIRTEFGYCTASFLLPQGAETAADIAVDASTVEQLVGDRSAVLRSPTYRVYAPAGRLVYVVEQPCPGDSVNFFLHIRPARERDLPLSRRNAGFDNYDNALNFGRRTSANRCLAATEMPAYEIGEAWTGQVEDGETIWTARIDGPALRPERFERARAVR